MKNPERFALLFHHSIIHNTQCGEAAYVPFDGRLDKEDMGFMLMEYFSTI